MVKRIFGEGRPCFCRNISYHKTGRRIGKQKGRKLLNEKLRANRYATSALMNRTKFEMTESKISAEREVLIQSIK